MCIDMVAEVHGNVCHAVQDSIGHRYPHEFQSWLTIHGLSNGSARKALKVVACHDLHIIGDQLLKFDAPRLVNHLVWP